MKAKHIVKIVSYFDDCRSTFSIWLAKKNESNENVVFDAVVAAAAATAADDTLLITLAVIINIIFVVFFVICNGLSIKKWIGRALTLSVL